MIKVENLKKSFTSGSVKTEILKGISINIPQSKFVVILGPSGSGKTTFLNIIAGLETFENGEIFWDDEPLSKLSKKAREKLRVKRIGYVFQEYFLLNNLTLLENVFISGKLTGCTKQDAKEALNKVGLEEHIYKLPDQLSGGQKQRVAIARAIVKNPEILICDEPTGALDTISSQNVLEVLKQIQKDNKTTIIMVTHNEKIAKISDRVINLKDGKVLNQEDISACEVSEVDW